MARAMEAVMADPRFQEQANLVAGQLEALMVDPSFQEQVRHIAEQMDTLIADPNLRSLIEQAQAGRIDGDTMVDSLKSRTSANLPVPHQDLDETMLGKSSGLSLQVPPSEQSRPRRLAAFVGKMISKPSARFAAPLQSLPQRRSRQPRRPVVNAGELSKVPPSGSSSGQSRLQQLVKRVRESRVWSVISRYQQFFPILAVGILLLVQAIMRAGAEPRPVEVTFAAFLNLVQSRAAEMTNVQVSMKTITFLLDGKTTFTRPVGVPEDFIWFLFKHGVDFKAATTSVAAAVLVPLFNLLFPIFVLAGVWSFMQRQLSEATGSVGKKASSLRLSPENLTFEDVAGIDTAKVEVQEIVSMLKDPAIYTAAGARLPSGVLMVGPPGSGKTLLARVMAAQARVPFFYCSGSDFVELFVGRGAARMRALFKEAAAAAPCIIFVDEIDALGKRRSLRLSGASDEVEQTLNQMLACMDGLDSSNNGVVVMGATNLYEILDPALTRPGRFDRLVRVNVPDEQGREAVLAVHTRKLKLGEDVNLKGLAKATQGYSGAELAAVANEAAIRAVRRSSEELVQNDFLSAIATFNAARLRLPSVESILPRPSWWPGGSGSGPIGNGAPK
eukprot:gnl/TRDRNA2_/TRDRNA2_163802_c1_seq1.p1 gnl/TRDRNA2_/TRDRNA2_163802_c1~~gnl/TRDRNA2_/TRDRNA2_163802_c1_seq1.p1  ORF type:complete len:638 (-),score=101.79 gnl/TRDRNA2_/TRDRNA2_163802_c1_seq1:49-1890(-)